MKEQAQQHANLMANAGTQEDSTTSPPVKKEAWRKGDLEAEAIREAQVELLAASTPVYSIEEKKLSKHAKRRANKKKKIIVSGGAAEDEDEYQQNDDEQD